MKIMKKYLFFAAAITLMVGCADDSVVNSGIETPINGELRPITFGSNAAATTRADFEGGTAATKLNNKFIVGGFKGTGTSTVFSGSAITTEGVPGTTTVYDNYQVKWEANTANTTTSNTSNWEYVGQPFLAPSTLVNSEGVLQSIKYWDYATTQYDFIAYSTSDATVVTGSTDPAAGQVHVTAISAANAGKQASGAYQLKGDAAGLGKCYIADMVTSYRDAVVGPPAYPSDYQNTVQFKFRSLSAKVRIALYETVPGYSVKNVQFYSAADDASPNATAKLFTTGGSEVFNEAGTYTVYFPTIGSANRSNTDYNKAHVKFTAAASEGTATTKAFGALTGDLSTGNFASPEFKEAAISGTDKGYLGRSSNAATYAGTYSGDNYYTVVLPNETGAVLNLKVNYTLVSTDGSGEVINVTGATAQVPAKYAEWKSGYAYTYLFKISQNSNGKTNPDIDVTGLYPITFDAVVMNDEVDGIQETITTVADPSITTYAKGEMVTKNNEYLTGANIYVVVENGTALGTALTVGTNANLYTVTLEDGAAQTINEASVANAIKNGGAASPFVVTDANGKKMTVTAATGLTAVTSIAAADAPDGNAITINGAKFTPAEPTFTAVADANLTIGKTYYTDDQGAGKFVATTAADASGYYEKTATKAGTYVFEFISRDKATGTYVSGTTYYTAGTGDTTVNTSGFTAGTTDVSSYYVGDPKKHYKIIKVVDKY